MPTLAHVPSRPRSIVVLFAVVLALAVGPIPARAHVEPPGIVELALDPVGARAGGYQFDGRLSLALPGVEPNPEVAQVVVRFEARGGSATIVPDVVRFDDPALDAELGATLDVTVPRGEVEIAAVAEAFDAGGRKLWGRADSVFVLAGTGAPRVGRSSVVELVRADLAERFARGAMSRSELDAATDALLSGAAREPGTATFAAPRAGGPGARGVVATTAVHGHCKYVVRDGTAASGPYRPIANAFVRLVDRQSGGDVSLGTSTTDANGDYQASVAGMRGDGTAVELAVRVFAYRTDGDTVVAAVGPANQRSSIWLWDSGAAAVSSADTTVDIVAGPSSLNANRAFSIFDVINVGYDYLRAQSADGVGGDPLATPLSFVEYPGSSANGAFFSQAGDAHLNIGQNEGFAWDVLFHEFGHYVQYVNGTLTGAVGQHFITGNNTGNNCAASSNGVCGNPRPAPLTKDEGDRMAWGEGWPTFFGTNLQVAVHAASFGVPTAGDTRYDDDADGFGYDLDDNTELARGRGEDNELAVQRVLWDLADPTNDESDRLALGTDLLIRLTIGSAKPVVFSQFWNALLPELPTSPGNLLANQIRAGAICGDHGIAPVSTAPADFLGVDETTPAPTFTWSTRGAGGSPNPIISYGPSYRLNRFHVQFYQDDFGAPVFTSPAIVTNGSTDATASYTPSPTDWATIRAAGRVQWIVDGRSDDPAPTTGTYLSAARTLGGEETGLIPPDKATLACAGKAAANVSKLAAALAKCHVKAIGAQFKAKPFDLAACETKATTGYDQKILGLKKCPACVAGNAASVRDAVHAFLDARNGDLFCTGSTAIAGGPTGFVPSDKDGLGCSSKLTAIGTKLGGAIVKCHVKAAGTIFKSKLFDLGACEAAAKAAYDKSASGAKKCPACAVSGATALRDAIEQLQDRQNGGTYCEGNAGFPE